MSTGAVSDKNAAYFQAIVPGDPAADDGKGTSHLMAFTDTAGDSLPFHEDTTILELFSTQDCWVLMKKTGNASVAAVPANKVRTYSKFIPGGITCFLGVPRVDGSQYCLSVVRNATSGTLYLTEGA